MTATLHIHQSGPALTLQDLGRPGHIAKGLTRGGAMDHLALHEAAALLAQPVTAAIEMIGMGGTFSASADLTIALTGAPMQATLDGRPLHWPAAHHLPKGAKLNIGGVRRGAIGYLTVQGGFATPDQMGAQSTHASAGLGAPLAPGDTLPLANPRRTDREGLTLPLDTRFDGGTLHMVRSLQTHLYGDALLRRFTETSFTRDARANRQGIRMTPPDGQSFLAQGGLTVVSEIIAPGDIQVTGDGAPFVLMREHQTTGGYPRIGTVLPSDMSRAAQAPLGAPIRFKLLTMAEARAYEARATTTRAALPRACTPLRRDPADMADLLSYNLVDGAISAWEDTT